MKAQDQPQYSNKSNECLNCAGDHRTHNCSMRQQPQASPASNSTGIYQNKSQFQNNLPQQHSQQSASTVEVSTPTLMVNDQLQTGPQGQKQQPSPQAHQSAGRQILQ